MTIIIKLNNVLSLSGKRLEIELAKESASVDCNLVTGIGFILPRHTMTPTEFYISTGETVSSSLLSCNSIKKIVFKEMEFVFTYSEGTGA